MERLLDPQTSLVSAQTLLRELDWTSLSQADQRQTLALALEQESALFDACLSIELPVRLTQMEMWAETACTALKAEKPGQFLRVVERLPAVLGVRFEGGSTCYKAVLAGGGLEIIVNCLRITKEVMGVELFREVFPGFQRIAWKQAFTCQFDLIKDLSSLLPGQFPLYHLTKSRETLLNEAVRSAPFPTLKAILESGILPTDLSNNLGMTGLMTAIQQAASDLEQRLEALLAAGSDPLANDLWMNSAFHYLLQSSKIAPVRER